MRSTLIALATLLATAAVSAQGLKSFDLPSTIPFPITNNFPFAGPIMRYQQWYSRNEWATKALNPVRVKEVHFSTFATGQLGRTVDLQLTMANASPTAPGSSFDSNLVSGVVQVFPRRVITLPTSAAGTFVLQLVFSSEFIWDGVSGVIVEVRIFGNGNNNSAFTYDFDATSSSFGKVTRLYTVGDPNATTAINYQMDWGLLTRFVYANGVSVPFGTGCPGLGNFVPLATTRGGLPLAGNAAWGHRVSNAAPARPAALVIGASNTLWGTTPLPLDLSVIFAQGCFLRVDPLVLLGATTIGGGPGGGVADLPLPIPGVTYFVGLSLYTQWFIDDPGAANGKIAASQGVQSIIGQ